VNGEIFSIPGISPALVGDSPELVSAIELNQWADRTEAKTVFPELMRRLFAQTPGITNLEIRVREGTSASGWDGAATSTGSTYLPAGELRCEFGTNQKVKDKADKDYTKRAEELGAEIDKYVYVFATPRNWPSGQKWASERRAEHKFADIKVIDAHTLEGWLQETPAVHYWLSERLGRHPREAQTLQAWWTRFQKDAKIMIPPQFYGARRDEQTQELLKALQADRPIAPVSVASTCVRDVLAFVYAALEKRPDLDRAIVITDRVAWAHLVECATSLLLIPLFSNPDTASALERGHRVLVAVNGDTYSQDDATILLPKVGRQEAGELLREAGVDFRSAERMAALARRSMAAFLRSVSRNPVVQKPVWLNNADTVAILVPLVLLGAWEDREEHDERYRDKEYIEPFVGKSMAEIRRLVVSLSRQSDPPFVQSGSVWRLVDPVDAAKLLLPEIGDEIVKRWQVLACNVLLAADPCRGMETSERLAAEICGMNSGCSGTLRHHVAEGLALAAVSSDKLVPEVRRIVGQLLSSAFADSTGNMLADLAPVLPLLAEAAPSDFLTAIITDLDRPTPIIRTLFKDADASNFLFGSSSPHPNIQRALEYLCWSEEYYGDAAMLLAGLAALDPGGSLGERPIDSLQKVTAGRINQSAASVDDKIAVVEQVMCRYPKIGWCLALELLKPDGTMILNTGGPHYRNWELPGLSVTYDEWYRFTKAILELATKAAADHPDRWIGLIKLIKSLRHLPEEYRLVLLRSLLGVVQASAQSWSDNNRHAMWSVLMTEIAHHEAHPKAVWAVTGAELDMLCEAAQEVGCTDDPRQHARLFGRGVDIVLDGLCRNDDGFDVALEAEQRSALEKIANQGLAAIQALTADVERPERVGELLAQTDSAGNADIIGWLNDRAPSKLRRAAQAYVSTMAREHGTAWLADIMNHANLEFDGQTALVGAIPIEERYWTWVATLDETLVAEYWRTANHRWIPKNERTKAVDLLIENNAPWRALDVIWQGVNNDDFLFEIAVVKHALNASLASSESVDPNHYSYVVLDLLKRMEAILPEDPELLMLEFWFFDFIGGDHEPLRALYRFLGNNPSAFVALVEAIYLGEGELKGEHGAKMKAFTKRSWSVLYRWSGVPGLDDDGVIDSIHLCDWISQCRILFEECGLVDVGDQEIGKVLASSPDGSDGAWPAEEVRDALENLKNSDIETGLEIGRRNQRGVSIRGIYDGGNQERNMAQEYRGMAKRVAIRWPRTAAVLRRMADSYECDARHLDEQDERRADEG
jgi:hypothetical protein